MARDAAGNDSEPVLVTVKQDETTPELRHERGGEAVDASRDHAAALLRRTISGAIIGRCDLVILVSAKPNYFFTKNE
mgnify:CR=1 FL=1